MAEEHLRQLIYSFAQKGKIEPWEYQEIQMVAQRHNVSPARMQTLITEVVNSIDYQNQPKVSVKPETVMSPFLKTDNPAEKKADDFLKPFQKPAAAPTNEPQWVRSEKKQPAKQPEQNPEPAAEKSSNTTKIVLLVILIAISLYILIAWSQPAKPKYASANGIAYATNEFSPGELEKYYNGLYYSNHKKSKTLLVLQLLNLDENRGRAEVRFQLDGQDYKETARIDFENHTIRIPKLGTATFYKTDNTVIIESNGSVNHWKIK